MNELGKGNYPIKPNRLHTRSDQLNNPPFFLMKTDNYLNKDNDFNSSLSRFPSVNPKIKKLLLF